MDYKESSHIKDWTFTPQQLSDVRTRANNEAYQFIQDRKNLEKQQKLEQQQQQEQQQQESSTSTADDNANAGASTPKQPPSNPPPIANSFAKGYKGSEDSTIASCVPEDASASFPTPDEEATLVEFYSAKLLTLVGPKASIPKLTRDIKVASTASLLLRLFFLSNSVTLFDPKTIMVACAFLACKVEDATCDIRYIEDGTKQMSAHVKIKDIIEAEVALVKGVDFDLCCFHAYKVVLAYTEDLRTFLKSNDGKRCINKENVSGEDLVPIYNMAREIVERVVFHSDIMLLSSPGKVGFAAMMLSNRRLVEKGKSKGTDVAVVEIDFRGYLNCRFANEKKEHEIEALWQEMIILLNPLEKAMDKAELDIAVLKGIHKKLKKCRIWGKSESKKKKKRSRNER